MFMQNNLIPHGFMGIGTAYSPNHTKMESSNSCIRRNRSSAERLENMEISASIKGHVRWNLNDYTKVRRIGIALLSDWHGRH